MKRIITVMLSLFTCCVLLISLVGCSTSPEIDYQPEAGKVSPTEKTESDYDGGYDESFVPDIIDDDEDKSSGDDFDDSVKYDYGNISFDATAFVENDGVFTSNGAGIALADKPFPYGTLSMTIRSKNTVDSGFVFGYTKTGSMNWEGEGIEYYFLFLGQGGSAYLGKTQNGKWSTLKVVQLSSAVDENKDYNLKVVYASNKILFYIDGELIFGYKDSAALKGTKFGFRTGASGVTFKDFTATSEYLY